MSLSTGLQHVSHPYPGGTPHNNEEGPAPHPHQSLVPRHTTATPHRDAAAAADEGAPKAACK
jgi:hypothetical protein